MGEPKFYFGDLAVVTMTGETGEVVGIWFREEPAERGGDRWVYRLKGLSKMSALWWNEDQLKRPSEVEK